MPIPAVIIAGTHSGTGKTTITLAVMAALVRRGLRVQGFKVGPDFIDPGHHTAVTGRISRNLDTWLLEREALDRTYRKAVANAELAVIEGAMGLFDGLGALDERGSAADLARAWGVPVVLVVDAHGLARSVAPLARGFATFDRQVRVAGVVANRVGSQRHYEEYLAPALRQAAGIEPLGYLMRSEALAIPSRHLGLLTAEEFRAESPFLSALADAAEATLDLDRIVALAQVPGLVPPEEEPAPAAASVRIAVARDEAFCFYYEDNLDLLRAAGAEIVPFSPLNDAELPEGARLVYLGGGYPELHAAKLAANAPMRAAIRRFHARGGALWAECGGLMACCQELCDSSGRIHAMWGLVPARIRMQTRLAALGYVTVVTDLPTLLGPAGTTVRGHEFHYSMLERLAQLPYATRSSRPNREGRVDGIQVRRLLAGYAHLHLGSNPQVARNIVAFASGTPP
ncbi:MAG TPA: cobyrinate a,c-diamide synthase [Isosphaeraceae bacterium]|nr:cobyrinate a,c-diamide synthase [Isosphaeraceae bacterium]